MKLDRPGAPHDAPLAPSDWTMEIGRDGPMHFAEVWRGHDRMCRVSIVGAQMTPDDVRSKLADKARAWIADYLERPHTGDTAAGAL